MDESEVRKLVLKHEYNIETLSTSISRLADSATTTNSKLDDVIKGIAKQNVLAEKLANIDSNLKESFQRVYGRLEEVERKQDVDGCPVLKILQEKVHGNQEYYDIQIKAINKRLEKNDSHKFWIVTSFLVIIIAAIGKAILK